MGLILYYGIYILSSPDWQYGILGQLNWYQFLKKTLNGKWITVLLNPNVVIMLMIE